MAMLAVMAAMPVLAWAQDVVGPGSTVQGDILRGQGQFLKGAAWYELNAAKAFELNSRTAIEWEKWNRQVYDAYMRDRAAHIQARRNLTKAQEEAARKNYEEREARLRANPTTDDIISGDALNALLVDLSDPSISPSSWRLAQVPLPADLSIPSLVFRFAPRPGDKKGQELGRGVIALARLDTIKGNPWGRVLSLPALAPERSAYEAAYARVRDECLAGNLSLDAPLRLSKAIEVLKAKVGSAVPSANGYRAAAARSADDLRDAAKIFHADTIDFAQEMIADTQRHDAKTVGELLAFMRKYRLLFANAERTVNGGELYGRLYGLLREQKEKLGGGSPSKAVAEAVKERAPAPIDVVVGTEDSLFNGRDFTGWRAMGPEGGKEVGGRFAVEGGEMAYHSATKKAGDLRLSSPPRQNFILRAKYLFPAGGKITKGGANVYFLSAGPKRFKTAENDTEGSLSLRLAPDSLGDLVIARNVVATGRRTCGRPPGQWNDLEVRMGKDHMVIAVNGCEVTNVRLESHPRSFIGLTALGTDVRFRDIRLQQLAD
jgi:Domain of Unknown Function (DUF1080)